MGHGRWAVLEPPPRPGRGCGLGVAAGQNESRCHGPESGLDCLPWLCPLTLTLPKLNPRTRGTLDGHGCFLVPSKAHQGHWAWVSFLALLGDDDQHTCFTVALHPDQPRKPRVYEPIVCALPLIVCIARERGGGVERERDAEFSPLQGFRPLPPAHSFPVAANRLEAPISAPPSFSKTWS